MIKVQQEEVHTLCVIARDLNANVAAAPACVSMQAVQEGLRFTNSSVAAPVPSSH